MSVGVRPVLGRYIALVLMSSVGWTNVRIIGSQPVQLCFRNRKRCTTAVHADQEPNTGFAQTFPSREM